MVRAVTCSCWEFIERLRGVFGDKFLVLVATISFFSKGISRSAISSLQLPFYQSLNLKATTCQAFEVIALAPWGLKVFVGYISDIWPLFGYRRSSWMILAAISGVTACGVLFFTDFNKQSAMFIPILLFIVVNQITSIDLLCESKYVEIIIRTPETKGDIVSLTWWMNLAGGLLIQCIIATLVTNVKPLRYCFVFAFLPLIISTIPIILG